MHIQYVNTCHECNESYLKMLQVSKVRNVTQQKYYTSADLESYLKVITGY
jgi:hypothetical protein